MAEPDDVATVASRHNMPSAPPSDDDDPTSTPEPPPPEPAPPAEPDPPTAANPSHASSQAPPSGSRAGTTTIASPLEALERDEILRTRRFCVVVVAIILGGLASVPLLPGDPDAALMVFSAGGASLVGVAILFRQTSDPVRFRSPWTQATFAMPAIAVAAVIPFYGAFSPAPVLLILGVYFTGLSSSGRMAGAVYAICGGTQALTGTCVILHVTRDTGLVHAEYLPVHAQWIIQGLIQMVLAATFITARLSRKTALLAVSELERAVRVAAHREALLLEAREELERALRAGRGRFSDQVIGGYQLGEVIGRGAMGEVYAATQGTQTVAIKLLSQASLGNPQHVQRFLRELRTAAAIRSPNVVHVITVGEQPVPYLVMEKLEGQTLGQVLRGRRALPPAKVIDFVRQAGTGLAAAAAVGVVHRDIKPQNLFLHHATWKILDFGVSRAEDHGDTLTSGHVVGTPSYMAPEQARGASVDHRTDLYALAACAYRALTGHPPHAAGEIAETLYRVVHTAPRRPSDLVVLPFDLDLVLAIGLAKRPEDRFATARELADALALAVVVQLPQSLRDQGE